MHDDVLRWLRLKSRQCARPALGRLHQAHDVVVGVCHGWSRGLHSKDGDGGDES